MSDLKQDNPIRVLHVLHVLDRGGAEAMVMNLYRRIDREKVQFDFLVHSPKRGIFEDEIEKLGGRIFRISAFKGYNLISYYYECSAFFKSHPEISIVHGHLGSSAAYYLLAAKRCGKFTIAHSHSTNGIKGFYDLSYKLFSYPTRWVADSFFGCSTEAGIDRYGKNIVLGDRYRNFNNAVDAASFRFNVDYRASIRSEFGLDENNLLIGTVGRITHQKNPYRVYSIFKEIIRQEPSAVCLWVGTGEMEEEMKRKIAEDSLSDKIIMSGLRADIPAVMSALDCMIFPSLWEGLPVSVVESQMANLPCVLSANISRETQISNLLLWHELSNDDALWANDAISAAMCNRGKREEYSFSTKDSGYDIKDTTEFLMIFYIERG